jgi:hypothetical protein
MLLDYCSTKMSTITWTWGIFLFYKSSISYKLNEKQKPTTLRECTNKDQQAKTKKQTKVWQEYILIVVGWWSMKNRMFQQNVLVKHKVQIANCED